MVQGCCGDPAMAEAKGEAAPERQPMARSGQSRELGETAMWLPPDASSFVTGTVISLDGGFLAN
jgi:NAD(P)-dependent dehydrogenase (short-subunit alcohol dehydrogenase family)